MSRPLRIELVDGLYHVTSRGDRQEPIFTDAVDRRRLLAVVARAMERFDASVLAYCLMDNHYHLVLHTRRANLSRLMHYINSVYSQAFNRRHGLVGHLFQGRFKAIHVDRDAYFLEVCRYVELNPVRAGLVSHPREWPWSSYRAHVGSAPSPLWLGARTLYGHLLGAEVRDALDVKSAIRLYVDLVESGRNDRLWDNGLMQEIYLGGVDFVRAIQERISLEQTVDAEIPRAHTRQPERALPALHRPASREWTMRKQYLDGASMAVVAKRWGLSVSRVSRLIKRAERMDDGGAT